MLVCMFVLFMYWCRASSWWSRARRSQGLIWSRRRGWGGTWPWRRRSYHNPRPPSVRTNVSTFHPIHIRIKRNQGFPKEDNVLITSESFFSFFLAGVGPSNNFYTFRFLYSQSNSKRCCKRKSRDKKSWRTNFVWVFHYKFIIWQRG